MATKRFEAVTTAGDHIGTYAVSDAMLLFRGAASVKNGKIVVDTHRFGPIDEAHGWRKLEEFDGTSSYWTPEAFEERFGLVFALNIRSMKDVRHFQDVSRRLQEESAYRERHVEVSGQPDLNPMGKRKEELSRSPKSKKQKPGHPARETRVGRIHLTRDEIQAVHERSRLHPVDRDGRRVKLDTTKDENERETAFQRARTIYKTSMSRSSDRVGRATAQPTPYWRPSREGVRTVSTQEHSELQRRNEAVMQQAMAEHMADHLKPAGRPRQPKPERKKEAKPKASTKKKVGVTAAQTTAKQAPKPKKVSSSGPMTDKQCLVSITTRIEDPFVADALKSMFYTLGMPGIVERAMMLLRESPRPDMLQGLDLDATDNVITYRYCKTDSTRLYCLTVVADAIAEKVSDADAEGPEPFIWALEHSKGNQGAQKRAALNILNDREHLILFTDDVYEKARSCTEELTILPYPTTLVRIKGIPNTWGVVACETSGMIEIWTIGERPSKSIGRALLAYIEHHCTPRTNANWEVDFKSGHTRHEGDSVPPVQLPPLEPRDLTRRIHVINTESRRESKQSTKGHTRRSPESIAPYTRRAHWRHQRFGKGNSQVKIIKIAETQVRPRGDGTIPFEQRVHVVI